MSIFIGGAASGSKNLWKIDDDLTVIEDSALVGVATDTVHCIRQDNAGAIYATANGTSYVVQKLTAALALDTSWATAGTPGEIDPTGTTIHAIDVTSAGKIIIGSSSDAHSYDTDGVVIWADKPVGGADPFFACVFDLATDSTFFVATISPGAFRFYRLTRAAGAIADTASLPSGGTLNATGILVDRTNFALPAHVYVHTYHGTTPKLACYNPDDLNAGTIWANSTNIVGNQAGNNTSLAADSNGNLYVAGGRQNSVSVLKINPNTGAIVDSFDTGSAANAIYIDDDDQIFVAGSRSGSKCVWRLDTDLVEQASLATSVLDVDILAVAGSVIYGPSVVQPKDAKYNKRLIAIAKSEVWQETPAGTMAVVSDSQSGGLNTINPLTAAEAFQKVFIANASVLKVTRFADTRLLISVGGGVNITISDVPPHGAVISSMNRAAAMVVDYVQRATSTTVSYVYGYTTTSLKFVVNDSVAFSGRSIGSVKTVAVGASAPFFHDYTVYPSVSTTPKTFGSLPGKATLIALYRGRIVLSGNPAYPFQWYMSRQNNPYDYAFFAADPQAPVAGGNSDAGELGDVVTALIPYKDDYLVFGCANTIWVMRGDPAAGGSLDEVSLTTGIFGPMSHCWDDKDNLYFFGSGGIYRIPPGFGPPENLTMALLPNIITDLDVDPSTHRIVMAYDRRRVGVLIAITALATGSNVNYWFDLKTQAFFPESYPGECGIYAMAFYEAEDSDYRRLVVGGRDAYIRYFRDSAKDDDAGDSDDAISSFATFGPIQLSQDPDSEGKIISLTVVTGTDTDGLTYDVHVADSAEETIDQVEAGSTPFLTGTVQVDNRIARIRIKCRGIYALVKLYNSTASQTWACEKVVAQITEGGRR